MGKSVIRTSALALALLLLPSLALAAGLGKLRVFSGLGQPLKAEIELLAIQKGEAANLSVRLPPAEAFRKAHIEYAGALQFVKFSIEQRGDAGYVVVLSSTQAINEPFLDLLVELDWNTGRLVREYTFLLDPPEYKGPSSAPAMLAPATIAPVIKSVELPKQPVAPARISAAERPAAAPQPENYKVKHGDTLTKIANANKADGVSLQQMLIALYRSNADAFDGNNINRMRAGKILNIPDADAVAAVDPKEAQRTVWAHAAEFNEYRRKLAGAVATAPERADKQRQSASGKITAKVEDKPTAEKAGSDQVRLSKTQEAGKPGVAPSAQSVQEDLFAKEKELKEANERIAMLEKNLQDMRKLLELKSQSGAQLQQQAAGAPATVTATAPAKAADVVKPPEPPKAAASAKAEDAAKAAPQAAEPKPAVPKAAAPKAPLKKVVAPAPAPERSLLDEILENELAPYLGVLLLLLFVGYFYYAWRRKKTLQVMESSVMGAPDFATDPVFGAAGGAKVDTGAGEVQADSLQEAGAAAAIDSQEVDPIAEADVYMAYGRDTQAEEILKEALSKDPSRQPIRVKLLEIYANRKDTKAFEAVATEVHAAGQGADWQKARTLGARLDPENPLYQAKGADSAAQAVTDTQVVSAGDTVAEAGAEPEASSGGLDFDLGMGEQEPGGATQPVAPAADAGAEPVADTTADLDFDLGLGDDEQKAAAEPEPAVAASEEVPSQGAAEAPADAVSSIDFDFELPGTDKAAQPAPAEAPAAAPELVVPGAPPEAPAAAQSDEGLDFDFNLDLPASSEQAPQASEQAPAAPMDLSAISLDLGLSGEAAAEPDAHWQEVATKLDLAKAYQEMGDKDGARELLNEVLQEGDAAQKQQAQTFLAALG